jgi:hypothetical protein
MSLDRPFRILSAGFLIQDLELNRAAAAQLRAAWRAAEEVKRNSSAFTGRARPITCLTRWVSSSGHSSPVDPAVSEVTTASAEPSRPARSRQFPAPHRAIGSA